MTPEQLFADLLAAQPAQPFVTYYDEETGERSELSVRSLANWVAKTHFLLLDELGLGVGDSALIALPAHWISLPAILGCLTAGLELTASDESAAVAFVEPATIARANAIPDVYAVAPWSAAVGFGATVPPGASDYVVSVRPQPDAWASVQFGASDTDPCFDGRDRASIVSLARARAAELGVASGARMLTSRDWTSPSDWLDTLLVPLAVGGSVVYVRNATEDVVQRRIDQERATITV